MVPVLQIERAWLPGKAASHKQLEMITVLVSVYLINFQGNGNMTSLVTVSHAATYRLGKLFSVLEGTATTVSSHCGNHPRVSS